MDNENKKETKLVCVECEWEGPTKEAKSWDATSKFGVDFVCPKCGKEGFTAYPSD